MLKEEMDRVRLNISRRVNGGEDTSTSLQKPGTRKRTPADASEGDQRDAKRAKTDGDPKAAEVSEEQPFEQSVLITGTTLKDYQLEGVAWMAGLHRAGMSGILGAYTGDGISSHTLMSTYSRRDGPREGELAGLCYEMRRSSSSRRPCKQLPSMLTCASVQRSRF